LKLIRTDITDLEKLGFEENLLKLLKNPLKGIYLLVAPFGHGKSIVRSSLLNYFNNEKKMNILSIEKNIDYDITSENSLVTQYEVGDNMKSYSKYVRLAYEIDPDILMVSHIPDLETLTTILDISESGRPVFITMESGSISGSLEKLFSLIEENKKSFITSKFINLLQVIVNFKMIPIMGVQRRVLVYEYVQNSKKLKKIIKEQAFNYIDSQLKGVQEFVPIEKRLADLFNQGKIDLETCEKYIYDLENLNVYVKR
jgi:Tfp pilus assembly pilus retraction ATPase PilT